MPWTPAQFSDRHNHSLHGERAAHAARIANAVLKSGVPEGESIAIANKWAMRHRDMGGSVDPTQIGGIQPTAQTQNPLVQSMIQRYASMPTEKLTEMATMLGGTQQGQIVQRLLQQRRIMPQQNPAPVPQQQQAQASQFGIPQSAQPQPVLQARGGATPHRAFGGDMGLSPSQATPWWTRSEARNDTSGFLHGSTPGRADSILTTAPGGAYVIPADVIAGLGEGNSLAGARVMDAIVRSGPYGTPQEPQDRARLGIPRPPAPYREPAAKGGKVPGAKGTPVALSHGEYVVHPEDVMRIGEGDMRRGHRILDHFVVMQRKKQVKKIKALPPPVGSKV